MVSISKSEKSLGHTYIQKWRNHVGLTQAQAGELLELSAPLISRVEAGKTQYTQSFIEKAAKAYGCTPGQLLDTDPTTLPTRAKIDQLLADASPEDLSKCLKIMETILVKD
ncbi:Helix-turn-helix domain-containing protein [Pseudovibrio denitrificans]|uniref:Helix-turn-helix domain-containing protein n=1 Tax=Pseudovibrio denitrificans TaxID=258256 RepID=A0A1I6ZW61_9HYPH|nr:helix-turn-helix transcriptional regulator [Pseudovibrio denitrificans]SFT66911.1 Helix-turn-helix domain-containing protein [Pseudovibrio denitrificans]